MVTRSEVPVRLPNIYIYIFFTLCRQLVYFVLHCFKMKWPKICCPASSWIFLVFFLSPVIHVLNFRSIWGNCILSHWTFTDVIDLQRRNETRHENKFILFIYRLASGGFTWVNIWHCSRKSRTQKMPNMVINIYWVSYDVVSLILFQSGNFWLTNLVLNLMQTKNVGTVFI